MADIGTKAHIFVFVLIFVGFTTHAVCLNAIETFNKINVFLKDLFTE